ncbi:hypothetical protein [Holospora curviuscula]|uniref:Uncharacterized protein n=1 Tax=Holospora curviuscula TaxID=1082868 RepID=A0A2S5R7G8_9PROT|nr:hypothetical protein [Holospora curviuscula]PPE03237.1 hypothetical protein HCUR_01318 [Holospora curviuscula]
MKKHEKTLIKIFMLGVLLGTGSQLKAEKNFKIPQDDKLIFDEFVKDLNLNLSDLAVSINLPIEYSEKIYEMDKGKVIEDYNKLSDEVKERLKERLEIKVKLLKDLTDNQFTSRGTKRITSLSSSSPSGSDRPNIRLLKGNSLSTPVSPSRLDVGPKIRFLGGNQSGGKRLYKTEAPKPLEDLDIYTTYYGNDYRLKHDSR